MVSGDGISPANMEELQLIEEHLRYNANVYNSHSSRKALKQFAQIPEVDVDFESEVERVLDTFRITELVKRNLRNRGLQGKELKVFENLVDAFRNSIVEDLVLVKKDIMEIRMRHAGYLRYTNKTAYNIVEDRYTDKDWKTGERITSSASDYSGSTSLSEQLDSPTGYVPCNSKLPFNTKIMHSEILEPPVHIFSPNSSPDSRHLKQIHTRITGDDGLGHRVIEPYHAPLLPLAPNVASKKAAVLQLRITENKENKVPAGMTNRGWLRRDVARQTSSGQPQPSVRSATFGPTSMSLKSPWGKTGSSSSTKQSTLPLSQHCFPSLGFPVKKIQPCLTPPSALAVQPPSGDVIRSLQGPESPLTPFQAADDGHPAVSQKKAKKAQREAKRKAKKTTEGSEKASSPTVEEKASLQQAAGDSYEEPLENLSDSNGSNFEEESPSHSSAEHTKELFESVQDDIEVAAVEEQATLVETLSKPLYTSILRTTHGKHDHWVRFTRAFVVDQLTIPLLQSSEGCSHGSSCRFESNGIPDCPFHEPRKSKCMLEILVY